MQVDPCFALANSQCIIAHADLEWQLADVNAAAATAGYRMHPGTGRRQCLPGAIEIDAVADIIELIEVKHGPLDRWRNDGGCHYTVLSLLVALSDDYSMPAALLSDETGL